MSVVIKELIVQGRINGNTSPSEEDLIKIIGEEIKKHTKKTTLSPQEKNDLIEECKDMVISTLESKFQY